MNFYKITSTLTRSDKNTAWFSTGDLTRSYPDNIIYHFKVKWVYPGYLVTGTDFNGVLDTLSVKAIDDFNCTWTRIWYSKHYYDQHLLDSVIKKINDQEQEYHQSHGIVLNEIVENYPAKITTHGRYYVGNYYRYSTHLNQ